MIQTGDVSTGVAGESVDYSLEAEFLPEKYIHRKGALAAARTGDAVNPEKKSSGSQFYIVDGEIFDEEGFRRVRKIFIQEFENKTYAPNRDETAGWVVALQMYKALRNSNKFNLVSAPIKEEEQFRMQISADFSKAKPGYLETPPPINDPLFKKKDLGIVGKGFDAVMIGAVTKFRESAMCTGLRLVHRE